MMRIEKMTITIPELIKGYAEKGREGEDGVVAYGGLLDVRPPYQRNFIYNYKEQCEVIRTISKGFPLNVMYWSKTPDGRFELMDGQQRTISICRYFADGYNTYSVGDLGVGHDNEFFAHNLRNTYPRKYEEMLAYDKLEIYVCEGTAEEIHDWFTVINIAGKVLTPQEILNTSYTGTWLTAAKSYFSRKYNCPAQNLAGDYMSGSPNRQDYLETVLQWIADRDGLKKISTYMGDHQSDENAEDIINYFKSVFAWVERTFTVKRKKLMNGLQWGLFYNRHKDDKLDPIAVENRIQELLQDYDNDYGVTNPNGIYEYILTGKESCLQIRAFRQQEKQQAYERQNHCCADCGKPFDLSEMEAHHKKAWADGGHTTPDNCVMLCKECHYKTFKYN